MDNRCGTCYVLGQFVEYTEMNYLSYCVKA
jgi:hypothetical protein